MKLRTLSIDPITRLEGNARCDVDLGPDGRIADCRLVVSELRGFEKLVEGRPVEELPRITSRICGVCPEAHLAASAKAIDALYGIQVPRTAELLTTRYAPSLQIIAQPRCDSGRDLRARLWPGRS